jgi:hypothetical protein
MDGPVAYWHAWRNEFKAAFNAEGIYGTVQGRQCEYANFLYTLA